MRYAKVSGNKIVKWPYTIDELKKDYPKTGFQDNTPEAALRRYGVVPVTIADKPSMLAGQRVRKNAEPTLVKGKWQIGWTIEDLPQDRVNEDINRERARRVENGVSVGVTGVSTTIPINGRQQDLTNLQALAFAAQMRIAAGDTTTLTTFRDKANVNHELTPPQIMELYQKGASWVSAVYAVSWSLKDGETPNDYDDDAYWPAPIVP